jgi:hypothetical protein
MQLILHVGPESRKLPYLRTLTARHPTVAAIGMQRRSQKQVPVCDGVVGANIAFGTELPVPALVGAAVAILKPAHSSTHRAC